MIVGEGAAGHQGSHDWSSDQFGEFHQDFCGAGFEDAATDIKNWLLGIKNQTRCFFNHPWMTFSCRLVARQAGQHLFVGWPMPCHLVLQNIFGNVNQHRTRSTSCGDMKSLTHNQRNVIGAHDQFVVFGHAARYAHRVALLESIRTNGRSWHLTCDTDHRD